MAMTVAEAESMEAARAAAGKLGGINFSYRNNHAFRFARELLAAGELGRLMRVSAVYLQSFLGAPATPYSWRNDVSLAGFGALGDLGVHMIDGVFFLTGLDYRRVVGLAQTLIPEKPDAGGVTRKITTDTNAAFLAELAGGVVATFETTQVAPGYGNYFRIEISGERGTLAGAVRPARGHLGAALRRIADQIRDVEDRSCRSSSCRRISCIAALRLRREPLCTPSAAPRLISHRLPMASAPNACSARCSTR